MAMPPNVKEVHSNSVCTNIECLFPRAITLTEGMPKLLGTVQKLQQSDTIYNSHILVVSKGAVPVVYTVGALFS